jgi:hypothetical protein
LNEKDEAAAAIEVEVVDNVGPPPLGARAAVALDTAETAAVWRAFQTFDVDGDLVLTRAELAAAFEFLGVSVTAELEPEPKPEPKHEMDIAISRFLLCNDCHRRQSCARKAFCNFLSTVRLARLFLACLGSRRDGDRRRNARINSWDRPARTPVLRGGCVEHAWQPNPVVARPSRRCLLSAAIRPPGEYSAGTTVTIARV